MAVDVRAPLPGPQGPPGPQGDSGVAAASEPATYDAQTRTIGVSVGAGLEVVGGKVAVAPPLLAENLAALPAAAANRGILARTADKATYWSDGATWVEIVPPIGTYVPVLAATTLTADRALAAADIDKVVESTAAGAVTLTIPANATTPLRIQGTAEVCQIGAGQVTVVAAGGVTLRAPFGTKTVAQYGSLFLRQRATDDWVLSGDATT